MLARFGDALEPLAVAREDVHAQFFFQFDDGLGHARLRRVQRLRGFGQVEIAARGFLNEAELVQIHIVSLLKKAIIMLQLSKEKQRLAKF